VFDILQFKSTFRDSSFHAPMPNCQDPDSLMSESLYCLSQNAADVPDGDDWLSDSEQSTLAGLRFAKRRSDWLLGRWMAKLAIRSCLQKDLSLSSLEIRVAGSGAPEAFWDNAPANVSISISHSNNRGLCAVGPSDYAIGCDLEQVEIREESIVTDYYTPEEISLYRSALETEKSLIVNLIWSAKESVLKILQEGLRRDTRSIRIDPDFRHPKGDWNSWTGYCLETSIIFYGWWRNSEGYVYTLGSKQPTSSPKQIILFRK
jgi:4'-phosphopantetheinyl transferase